MQLDPEGREYYNLEITTSPAVSGGWSASFDQGATWVAGVPGTVDGVAVYQWLIAGPDAEGAGTPDATITASILPLVATTEGSERIVRPGPSIILTTTR